MAKLMRSNGVVEEVKPTNGTSFALKELQDMVGGYIEIVGTNNKDIRMVANEEGVLEHLHHNVLASEMMADAYGPDAFLVGDVVLVHQSEMP